MLDCGHKTRYKQTTLLQYINLTILDVEKTAFGQDGFVLSIKVGFKQCVGHNLAFLRDFIKVYNVSTVILSLICVLYILATEECQLFNDTFYIYIDHWKSEIRIPLPPPINKKTHQQQNKQTKQNP